MNFKRFFVLAFVLIFVASISYADDIASSAKDRKSVALTIYNQELALVKEVRAFNLKKGVVSLRFEEVASRIDPTSVQVNSVGGPGFFVLEQNYEFDLITPSKLMEKYVNKRLKIVLPPEKEGDKERIVDATLLSTNEGYVYKVENELFLWFNPRVILPTLPKDLVSRPTLVWMIDGKGEGVQDVDVSYLTSGFGWQCDYILALSADEKSGDFSGWVTITNASGATYEDASVQLIAGEIHMVRPPARAGYYDREVTTKAEAAPQFAEEAFFEYHLYTLNRNTTVKDRQTKQISLLNASDLPLKKHYIVRSQSGMWGRDEEKGKVGVFMEFENAKSKGLGMALPKGKVRVYKKDKRGQAQFLGEDAIDHTPVDEKVKIEVGKAFDIVYEGKVLNYRQISRRVQEYDIEYEIRNHKEEAVTIEIEANIYGDWEILKSTHKWTKETANRARFEVPVGAKAKQKVSYTIRVSW